MSERLNQIIKQFKDIQDGLLWMGENFEKKIQKIKDNEVFIRPEPSIHSIAELIAHLTAWRKDALHKITTGKGHLVDGMPENWPTNTQLKEMGWDTIWKEHLKSRSSFVNLLEKKQDSFLNETYFDPEFNGNYPYSFAIEGILHHEIYHLGQIGLVVKLLKEKN